MRARARTRDRDRTTRERGEVIIQMKVNVQVILSREGDDVRDVRECLGARALDVRRGAYRAKHRFRPFAIAITIVIVGIYHFRV